MSGRPTGQFDLVDHHGRPVSAAAYAGRFMLVYFGFTHCRVVCPRALAKLSAVLERAGSRADAVMPLYVTVDPARDTAAVMKAYLETRHSRFTGLTGTAEQIDAAKHAFRVFAARKVSAEADPNEPEGYDVPHTAIAYLMGPDGAYRAHFADSVSEDTVLERLTAILAQG